MRVRRPAEPVAHARFRQTTALKEVAIDWDVNVHWTEKRLPYKFVIEGSTDAKEWKTLADHSQSENTNPTGIRR